MLKSLPPGVARRCAGWRRAINKEGVRTSTRDGGTLIEYEDEDPQIRRDFENAIKSMGVPMEMPQFSYANLPGETRASL
jgi:hypothetical protein